MSSKLLTPKGRIVLALTLYGPLSTPALADYVGSSPLTLYDHLSPLRSGGFVERIRGNRWSSNLSSDQLWAYLRSEVERHVSEVSP